MSDTISATSELTRFLQDLVRIPSVNPALMEGSAGEGELAAFLRSYLEEMGLEVREQTVDGDRKNVIAVLRGTGGGKTLLLNGHMDTVDTAGMTVAPFEPLVSEGRLYGRGSLDMKGGLAAMVFAVRDLVARKVPLKGDVILTFVVDEEYVSIGTEALVREAKADGAIVCEPTDLTLNVAHKGFVWVRLRFTGKAAHGSRPDLGVDAIRAAGHFLAAMDRFEREELSRKTHPLLGHPSVHASLISGGSGISTYPAECVLEIERRTLPGETVTTVTEELERILSGLSGSMSGFACEMEPYFSRSPLEVPEDSPLVHSVARAFKKICGEEVPIGGFSGWADSALLADAGIPAVNFGPCGMGLHAAEEYVEIESVERLVSILSTAIADFCG